MHYEVIIKADSSNNEHSKHTFMSVLVFVRFSQMHFPSFFSPQNGSRAANSTTYAMHVKCRCHL